MLVTKTQLTVAGTIVFSLAVAVTVKSIWFPGVAETFFQLNYQDLEKAPAHVLVLRPSRFVTSQRSGCLAVPFRSKSGQYDPAQLRMVGRDVSLAEVIGMAYQCPVSALVLPPIVPTNRYDFLVTVPGRPAERFRAAVKSKLGYIAHWEERDANVLVLKVQNPNSPGLQPSSDGAEKVSYNVGRYYYRHAALEQIVGAAEERFKRPVIDRTGLTGFYDFELVGQGPGRNRPTDEAFNQSLAGLGLTLDSDTESMRMMVVEEVK